MVFQSRSMSSLNEIVNTFIRYFATTFSPPLNFRPRDSRGSLRRYYQVETALKSAPLGTGYDLVPGCFLRKFASELSPHFLNLFNHILCTKEYPKPWKVSKNTPLFKSNDREDVTNYRPISNLSKPSLVFEKILHTKILNIVQSKISSQQHGFMKRRATFTQLLQYVHHLSEAADKNTTTFNLYLDFAKAFDKVPHQLILSKLQKFGIGGRLLKLIRSYLSDRWQYVCVNGVCSEHLEVFSGVPQGSILGPLLFIIFINDLPDQCLNSLVFLFADDSKLSSSSLAGLEADFIKLLEWTKANGMLFNLKKNVLLICPHLDTSMDCAGEHIISSKSVKDLGLVISSNLSWHDHIVSRVNSSMRSLNHLKRSIPFHVPKTIKLNLYKSYVLSSLLYCSPVWHPNITQLNLLEKVQARATKWICGSEKHYKDRLQELKLLPISFRLQLDDLVLFNRLLCGIYDLDVYQFVSIVFNTRPGLRM